MTEAKPDTPEQSAIYEAVRRSKSNLMINALAGTGKTHVLERVQSICRERPVCYLVFNRKNADEAIPKMRGTTVVRTINGMGHRVWGANGRTLGKPDARKPGNILREMAKDTKRKGDRESIWVAYDAVVAGVNLAKALGYVPTGTAREVEGLISRTSFHSHLEERPDDLVADLIDAVLRISIAQAFDGTIDYNDQVYMPALWGGTFPKPPLVMVDEYQDLSPVDHALVRRLVNGHSRIIGVGDPWQSIYGFRGASASGMADASAEYQMGQCALSVSFRCPSEIVRHVHWRVPSFRAHREGGEVIVADQLWADDISPAATIICRNNAPLLALAFKLLAHGHSVSVAGSDVGPRVVKLLQKLGPESLTRAQALSAIDDWLSEKLANESTSAPDIAECMRVFCKHGSDLGSAIAYANHLFAQEGSIRLMTGHKSKGLEFEDVIHLDPWLCKDTEQDMNLRYVVSTRSADQLIEVDSDRIVWSD